MGSRQHHDRRSLRLKGYDYTQPGAYFVTINTWRGVYLFGEIKAEEMRLNRFGELAGRRILLLQEYFPIHIYSWVVMPNHIHMILVLEDSSKGEASELMRGKFLSRSADASPLPNGTKRGSLGAIIQNYKSVTSRQINQMRFTPGKLVWQRNYYEHIIRDELEMSRIHDYIIANPISWSADPENQARVKHPR